MNWLDKLSKIISNWWMIPLFVSIAGFLVPYKFQRIINDEIERGGEEFGERVVARIQKWAVIFMVFSAVILIAMIGYWVIFDIFKLNLQK